MQKKCNKCGKPIPKERLEALPHTTTCVKCSEEKGLVGIWDDASSETIMVPKEEAERYRDYDRRL